jgi:lipoyl(octanoyl) transferase
MDLEPFGRINPCGYAGLPVTDLARAGASRPTEPPAVARQFGEDLIRQLDKP